ncbi:hypothetical protein [Pseudomonas putida]|jgi:1,5-rhamnosyltransferase|uniref:hypothetical protein n=1 Tax=Pseudomonas putida TaxID=303 RepID=UPI003D97C977
MTIYFLGWTAQYEKLFIADLAEKFDVVHLPEPKKLNRLNRIASKLAGNSAATLLGKVYGRSFKFQPKDLLICNEGQIHRKLNPAIIDSFPGQRILLVRDLVTSDFLKKWASLFHAIYSFDQNQCDELGMTYLSQFFPMGYTRASTAAAVANSTRPNALFIGREKGRGEILLQLADVLAQCGCELDFRILVDEGQPKRNKYHITERVDYRDSIAASLSAKILIEINQLGQTGLTLRTLEAAYFGKKLITNNRAITESNLYNAKNIYILDDQPSWDVEAIKEFLSLEVEPVTQTEVYKYSPEFMLESLLHRHGGSPDAERRSPLNNANPEHKKTA